MSSETAQYVLERISPHVLGSILIAIVGWGSKSLSDLSKNVQALNIKIAVVLERIDGHEHRITKLEGKKK